MCIVKLIFLDILNLVVRITLINKNLLLKTNKVIRKVKIVIQSIKLKLHYCIIPHTPV